MKTSHAALLLIVFGVSCAASVLENASFSAQYTPVVKRMEVRTAPACSGLRQIKVEDGRTDPNVVGSRRTESGSGEWTISLMGSATDWARSGVEQVLRFASVGLNRDGSPDLHIKLNEIDVEEVTAYNAEYSGRVGFEARVVSSAGGRECYRNTVNGTAQNYGSSGKAANYQETVNHALDRAVSSLLGDEGFHRRPLQVQVGSGPRGL